MTDVQNRLHEAALPYGADLVAGAAADAARNLSASYTQDLAEVGTVSFAEQARVDRVMRNLEHAAVAIADAHAGCRRKRCRVCDNIRVTLVELIAFRTSQVDTLPDQIAATRP